MEIREMRQKLGCTQIDFAKRYHIPFRTIQNWELGNRKPPEYIIDLLERQIDEDLINRKTIILPKYDPRKKDLPKTSDYLDVFRWLQAVRKCIDEPIVFALDEAFMCQGRFLGRSDEFLIWAYGSDALAALSQLPYSYDLGHADHFPFWPPQSITEAMTRLDRQLVIGMFFAAMPESGQPKCRLLRYRIHVCATADYYGVGEH